MDPSPLIRAFFDEATFTITYLVADPDTGRAAVIDPVLDFDPESGKVSTRSARAVLDAARAAGWEIDWVLETHAHADHLSAAPFIKERTGAAIAIGEHIGEVQTIFTAVFDLEDLSPEDAGFDRLLRDGEQVSLGGLTIEVLHVPGHTPADVAYRIGDAVFVGDTLFMPDYGTARADFPGGDARQLYRSIRRILALPEQTRLFMCHDYKAPGRTDYRWETTVGEEFRSNVQIGPEMSEDAFVQMRQARDATLAPPRLLLPSIQVNIRAGHLPEPARNGTRYLRIPLRIGDDE